MTEPVRSQRVQGLGHGRRTEQLAGVGADPADVDAVAHRYDPQHEVVAELISHHPAVRAADRAAALHRAAWVRAWRQEVGDHPGDAMAPPVVPIADVAARCFPVVGLDETQAADVRVGRRLPDLRLDALTALVDDHGTFLALYRPAPDGARPEAVFVG